MEATIFIMTIFIWIVIGLWINHKRNWYKFIIDSDDRKAVCSLVIIFAPISLIIVFFKEFLINPWNND
jgi:hypothetical protein